MPFWCEVHVRSLIDWPCALSKHERSWKLDLHQDYCKLGITTVELGEKKHFGHPEIVPFKKPNIPYPYEVNWHLVMGNGSLTSIFSLSKCSLSPSLTVLFKIIFTHFSYELKVARSQTLFSIGSHLQNNKRNHCLC